MLLYTQSCICMKAWQTPSCYVFHIFSVPHMLQNLRERKKNKCYLAPVHVNPQAEEEGGGGWLEQATHGIWQHACSQGYGKWWYLKLPDWNLFWKLQLYILLNILLYILIIFSLCGWYNASTSMRKGLFFLKWDIHSSSERGIWYLLSQKYQIPLVCLSPPPFPGA
jgi:hypothetical protein